MPESLTDHSEWLQFLEYKTDNEHISPSEKKKLREFVEAKAYREAAERIMSGEALPFPKIRVLNKRRTGKKRTVYIFPKAENYIMKFLAFKLYKYDGIFSGCLYSFRKGRNVKQAVRRMTRIRDIGSCYVYKADIHDYFNSVDVDILLPELREILEDDPALFQFFDRLLRCPYAVDREGKTVRARKGIMAGTPVSPFLANVYLASMDRYFEKLGVPYARYSDDIIVFGRSEEEIRGYRETIRRFLHERGLVINPDKEEYSGPGESWVFLGFIYRDGQIDVAPVSVEKLKAKMRRKARALIWWRKKKGKDGGQAARAFIRRFNTKLYENPRKNELTWTRWYFPVLTTDESLHVLDCYMQDCIRYIYYGNHGKKRYNLRYGTMKEWGYRSLVNEYYKGRKEAARAEAEGAASKEV